MGDDPIKRAFVGLVKVSPDWCWNDFIDLWYPGTEWAIEILSQYVQPGDHVPSLLSKFATKGTKCNTSISFPVLAQSMANGAA